MDTLSWLTIGVVTAVILLFVKAIKVNRYWIERGIPQPKPWPIVGNMLPVILKRRTFGDLLADFCRAYPNEPVIGFYFFMQPSIIPNDLELVERILIKDFPHFVDRSPQPRADEPSINISLFNVGGNIWRAIRARFSPMFTTGKLRHMFPQILGLSDDLLKILEHKTEEVDLTDYLKRFGMDVIAKTAFGIDGKAMEEESEFRDRALEVFAPSVTTFARSFIAPELLNKVGIGFISERVTSYFGDAVKDALNYRRTTGAVRSDFIQHMVTLQEKGYIEVERDDVSDRILKIDVVPEIKVEMTDDLMAGQSLGFLLAGFEATGIGMAWLFYELALNPDVQQKARASVREVMKKYDGKLDYDIVREMTYLSFCLKEANRLHSVVTDIQRVCTKPYEIPGTSVIVQPGQYVYVPNNYIHYDPKYYPQPEKFLPDRWSPEHTRPSCAYLPWGIGPRMCIGMRLGSMEMLCASAKLLNRFDITLHPSVQIPPRKESYAFFNVPATPIKFNLRKLEA